MKRAKSNIRRFQKTLRESVAKGEKLFDLFPRSAKRAVANGAKFMDMVCDNWFWLINLELLDMSSGVCCILGQTPQCFIPKSRRRKYDSFNTVIHELDSVGIFPTLETLGIDTDNEVRVSPVQWRPAGKEDFPPGTDVRWLKLENGDAIFEAIMGFNTDYGLGTEWSSLQRHWIREIKERRKRYPERQPEVAA